MALFAKHIIIITRAAAFSVWFLKFKTPQSPIGIPGVTPNPMPRSGLLCQSLPENDPSPGVSSKP